MNDDELPLFYNPKENVRSSDPSTSHAAATSITVTVTEVQRRVLGIHRGYSTYGLTDEQLLDIYHDQFGTTAESSPRKRRHDLTRLGIITDSGLRRELKTGRKGIVWKLVQGVGATINTLCPGNRLIL